MPSGECATSRRQSFLTNILFPPSYSAEREYVIQEDFMKAVRKVSDNKKLESKLDYKPV